MESEGWTFLLLLKYSRCAAKMNTPPVVQSGPNGLFRPSCVERTRAQALVDAGGDRCYRRLPGKRRRDPCSKI
jgi:hypothetical protein